MVRGASPVSRGAHRESPIVGSYTRVGPAMADASSSTMAGSYRDGLPSTVAGMPPRVQQMVYFEELTRLGVPRTVQPAGLVHNRPIAARPRHPEADRALRASDSSRRDQLVPGDERARRRKRPGRPANPADLVGDKFVVNGQKVWTSGAHDADYCFCFVRTDPDAPKHSGISVLVIDMRLPGIETRPLAELTDRHHADFNEVFFTDVEVGTESLVGELHHGWSIAGGSLAHERGMLWINEATSLERFVEQVVSTAHHTSRRRPASGR